MTEIDKLTTSLIHVGGNKNQTGTGYLQIFNKKRKTRWDDNIKSYVKSVGRKSRWGAEYEKTFTPLPFTQIPDNIDIDDYEILIRKYRLEDVSRRIQASDWENIDPDIRSPSPEPIYDSRNGHRLNTREIRTKEKYLKEKNLIIEELMLLDKNYIPPSDYRPPKKIKKIYINESDNEKHKLVGLILGPGGVTQRELEKKSGCRISVRGKGSNWSNNSADKTYHDESEALHVFLQSDTEENIRKATALIEPILDPFSEEHIKHKHMQKQTIAIMYGYQTDTSCENCGERHRTWACPQNFGNFTKVEVQCLICKDKSHPTKDCPERLNLIDKSEAESDLYKFIREIDDFKKNADVPVLEPEIKSDNIRNSVLFKSKLEREDIEISHDEKFTKLIADEAKHATFNEEQRHNNLNYLNQNIQSNQMIVEQSMIIQNNNSVLNTNQQLKQIPMQQPIQIPLNYKAPMNPILDNPNVIRAAPVNYFAPQNPFFMQGLIPGTNPNTNYYGSVLNPYLNSGNNYCASNYTNMPGNSYSFNRGLNLISSNFQGKIPMSYGVNQGMNMMNFARPPMSNFPAINMHNYRMNVVGMVNTNLIRNVTSQSISPNKNYIQPPEPEELPIDIKRDDIEVEKLN